MDDGLIDVRILETGTTVQQMRILSRSRSAGSTAARSTTRLRVPEFRFTAVDGPTASWPMTARSGIECDEASFSVRYRALPVFRPLP